MKKLYSVALLLFLFTCLVLVACKKTTGSENGQGNLNSALVLTTSGLDSTNGLTLVQLQAASNIALNWTTGSNYGTNAPITYTLQIDKKGNNFSNPLQLQQVKAVYTWGFTVAQFNDSLLTHWKAGPDTIIQLQARIIAVVSAPGIAPDTSNVVTVSLTPYQPVSTTLYLIGTAAPNGLNASFATPLTPGALDPTTFTYQGTLTAGTYKFITTLGQVLPSYDMGADSMLLVYRTSSSQPDNQFTIHTTGTYSITLNLLTLAISCVPAQVPPYSQLWIIGSPFPSGYDINASDPTPPAEMMRDAGNPYIFAYKGVIGTGEFKIPTAANGNFNIAYYRPLVNDPPITATGAQLVPNGGGPADADDYKWDIYTAGPYQITLNTQVDTISIVPFVPYTQVWIMGQINGWSTDGATPMVLSSPYVFTYTGEFPVGEFKIPTTINNASNYTLTYFRPFSPDPPIADTAAELVPPGGGPADASDWKWNITTAGTYQIVLNQLTDIIHINYVGP